MTARLNRPPRWNWPNDPDEPIEDDGDDDDERGTGLDDAPRFANDHGNGFMPANTGEIA